MRSTEIRQRFLDYFIMNEHTLVPSSSLVPTSDPTLLFTNAGMVQFKGAFLGQEQRPYSRATSSQKCVRAGGKHNDLEEVGRTARHHTFFEMLGNFSFGDYFKGDAIRFGWELCTEVLGLEPDRLWATVHHTDDEAYELWREVAGLPASRILRFGDADNFWQMADTGPCGPSSEIHYDQRTEGLGEDLSAEAFAELVEAGSILEFWNLVFMQFEKDESGALEPLPKPSIDTGAGLERIAAILQGVDSNFHTDLFMPLIQRAEDVTGRAYTPEDEEAGVSFRVLADHARASAFLIADGVFPTNEGRGYVLRRIMRRAGRHAWLMGRREPTLFEICDEVISLMSGVYPELAERRDHILRTTQAEEERFMATIDGGMERFAEITARGEGSVIAGADAFRLYDTYGFPLDLTQLMAEERGFSVDIDGFERSLETQRERSREERVQKAERGELDLRTLEVPADAWERFSDEPQEWVGYEVTDLNTQLLAAALVNGRAVLELRENPFYAEAGGQVSDRGLVEGDGWRMRVEDVVRVEDRVLIGGPVDGELKPGEVHAVIDRARRDTQRNHTATHLLHAALRVVLGEHVTQAGSLVAPDRLRFDFTHTGPMTAEEIAGVERLVNEQIWANVGVTRETLSYDEAIARGAMALFGEKYGDEVRVIGVPGFSLELCGGCHVRSTGEIGLFRIASETGSAAGVRRIEAVTGPVAYGAVRADDEKLDRLSSTLKVRRDDIESRVESLVEDRRGLQEELVAKAQKAASGQVTTLIEGASTIDGARIVAGSIEATDSDGLRAFGDELRRQLGSGVGVISAAIGEKHALLAVVTDDLITRGVRADAVMKEVARLAGGKGGGKPHLAQGSVGEPEKAQMALQKVPEIVRPMLEKTQG